MLKAGLKKTGRPRMTMIAGLGFFPLLSMIRKELIFSGVTEII